VTLVPHGAKLRRMWAIYFALASPQNPAQFSSSLLFPSYSWLEMSRRDDVIVAWHEVPRGAPPQKIRPVGYGVILAGVRTNRERLWPYMGGIAKQNGTIPKCLGSVSDHLISVSRSFMLETRHRHIDRCVTHF